MVFRPLSQRSKPDPAFDGPNEGLPPWMFPSIVSWLDKALYVEPYAGARAVPNVVLLQAVEVALRLDPPLNWGSDGFSAIPSALERMQTDGDFALDLLDYLLSRGPPVTLAADLSRILTGGGSAWEVQALEGGSTFHLVRRATGPVADAIEDTRPASQRAHAHLVTAWGKLMGRNPDPSSAYREAIRAVEAAARTVVIPNDPVATLGKIIKAMRDKPGKWSVDLEEATTEQVADMAAMIWQAQFDRHGTDDESVPLTVSQEQADAAMYVAIALVRLFAGGHVKQVRA